MNAIESDRLSTLLLQEDPSMNLAKAHRILVTASLFFSIDDAVNETWGQAALLTLATCSVRMFRGGVYFEKPKTNAPTILGSRRPLPISSELEKLGCRSADPPRLAFHIHIGTAPDGRLPGLYCWADQWVATCSPTYPTRSVTQGTEIAGAAAGAMAATAAFRTLILSDPVATGRSQSLAVLSPSLLVQPNEDFGRLPALLWLVGLGNLGQAALWVISLLPYFNPSELTLHLQDFDLVGRENHDTQVLMTPGWIGQKKTRMTADWAEQHGFRTVISEQRFTSDTAMPSDGLPLILAGVDNLEARRTIASKVQGTQGLVIDCGLGARPSEIFDISLHSFPGKLNPGQVWPGEDNSDSVGVAGELQRLLEEGLIDECGAITLANISVGIPSVAVVAACLQVAQACRAVTGGTYCDSTDLSLRDCNREKIATSEKTLARRGLFPTTRSR
jgi:hypothetical protein